MYYFFNIPTHAPIIYTLKSTKFTLKHLTFALFMFRSIFKTIFRGARGQYFMQLLSTSPLKMVLKMDRNM
jgi:hypothetical protein